MKTSSVSKCGIPTVSDFFFYPFLLPQELSFVMRCLLVSLICSVRSDEGSIHQPRVLALTRTGLLVISWFLFAALLRYRLLTVSMISARTRSPSGIP